MTLNDEKSRIIQIIKIVSEGVGDTYADKTFHTTPTFADFEYRFKKEQSAENQEELIYIDQDNGLAVIKNPKKSIGYIGPNVRGVIDKRGNLYIEMQRALMHNDIISGLEELGYIDTIVIKSPPTEYICIQKHGSSNQIYLAEMNPDMYPDDIRPDEWKDMNFAPYDTAFPVYQNFLNNAKINNPKFDFINKVIRYMSMDSNEDYEDVDFD